MFGNQLVTSTSIFTVGYVIGQVPFNLLLTRVSPRWVIPSVSSLIHIVTLGEITDINISMSHSSKLVGAWQSYACPV
jgi:hypothetical protein